MAKAAGGGGRAGRTRKKAPSGVGVILADNAGVLLGGPEYVTPAAVPGAGRFAPGALTATNPPIPPIRTNPDQPTAIVTIGLPAAGKTTVLGNVTDNRDRWAQIDADRMKQHITGYDPKNPDAVHTESTIMAFQALRDQVGKRENVIWDITGVNPRAIVEMKRMQQAGYNVVVVHVDVPVTQAKRQNAKRERTVPDHVIDWVAQELPVQKPKLARWASTVHTIDNRFD